MRSLIENFFRVLMFIESVIPLDDFLLEELQPDNAGL